ncbi:putative mfs sugar [Phaeomoniella chlamydospora]|uniref:Putative mfs sugar n=1 Tax=Phaeomoniella chlamydospora TaxID=158046 RepID=A0A0G2E549_PHACM|nr:putative mfs sugar [Phaeomoniella chlamydospora]
MRLCPRPFKAFAYLQPLLARLKGHWHSPPYDALFLLIIQEPNLSDRGQLQICTMDEEKIMRDSDDKMLTESGAKHYENKESKRTPSDIRYQQQLSAQFENPLKDLSKEQLLNDVTAFCEQHGLMDHLDSFKKGALVAQAPAEAMSLVELDDEDRKVLTREHTHKWSQPWQLFFLASMCSLAAAVQGMDETVNNGAQALYLKELNITVERFGSTEKTNNITGLVVGAPYLASAVLGCWLTEPLNAIFARRGTIFITCLVAAVASVWEGVADSWVNLFLARFVLGLGIGSKSSTVPIFTAECAPAPIRGALVMQWQIWTAFGII